MKDAAMAPEKRKEREGLVASVCERFLKCAVELLWCTERKAQTAILVLPMVATLLDALTSPADN